MKDSREIIKSAAPEPAELERPFESQFAPVGRYPNYRDQEFSEGLQLLDYWRAIRKRLWLVVGIAVICTVLAAIYMARKPNIYMATAVVQVDNEQINPEVATSERQRIMTNADPSYFNTQLSLLNSDSLIRRVIKEHSLDTNKEFLDAVKGQGGGSAFRGMLKAIGLASDVEKKDEGVDEKSPLMDSSLVSADEIAEAVRLEPYVKLIQRDLGVEPVRESRVTVKDTRLIEISFRHTDPDLAAAVVNSIGETFVNANQEKRSGTNRKTSDFLQGRIADLQSQIRSDEVKLVDMQKSEQILKTGETQTIAMDRLSALNKSLLEAENRRKNAEAQYNSVKDDPEAMKALAEQQTIQYTAERQNSILSFRNSVEKDINTLRANRQRMLVELKEKAPEIVEIDRQIQSLEDSVTKAVEKNNRELAEFRENTTDSILKNLRTKYLQAKSEEDKIRAAFNTQYAEAQGQNTGAVMLRLLEQNIETNKGFLEDLQKQQSSNDVAAQGTDNNIRVQSFAIPPKSPVSPSRTMSVLGALFLSTLFGMGLALFLEYLDDTIRSTEEIENYLQLPALATIPSIDSTVRRKLLLVGSGGDEQDNSTSELLISADTRSSLAEAYRQLRTSILLSTAGHPPKTLLITSSLPAEGKTTTATNTAISLAQTGAKVLIIDADMRRARLHSIFNLTNGEGLSTLLSSKLADAEIAKAIKYDEGTKLHIMTSGPIPPNPAELIGSEQMAKLLKMLQSKFTHVVVDSPPIASFTDGVLIASMVDGVILVVHSGKSSRQIVRRARQFLVDVGAKIVGVVLNNVNLRAQDNYYYYQSYYHGDSYVTSEEEDEE